MDRWQSEQQRIKTNNLQHVLTLLRKQPMSRIELSRETGLSATSITRLTNLLYGWGYLYETDIPTTGGVGRKATLLHLLPAAEYSLGIHLDDRSAHICLLDLCYNTVGKESVSLSLGSLAPEDLLSACHAGFIRLIGRCGVSPDSISSGGIAAVGAVNNEDQTLVFSPQLGWRNIALSKLFSRRFSMPFVLENDAKASLIGEIHFSGYTEDNIAFLQAGSGVGCAATHDGKVIRGQNNMAGEVGHIVLDSSEGILCDCGRKGCLQTHIAERFLVAEARFHDAEVTTMEDLQSRYHAGNAWAVRLIENSCRQLRNTLNILVSMYNPGRIIVNGDFFACFSELLPGIGASLEESLFTPLRQTWALVIARAEENSGALGAAILAQRQSVARLVTKSRKP